MPYTSSEDHKALEKRSLAAATVNDEPSKTVQGPALEADVNFIAKTYGLTGKNLPLPPEIFDPRHYRDETEAPESLQQAIEFVRDAERQFATLPANLRARFSHSPGILWDWLQDARNHPEAVTLGLLVDRTPAPPPSPKEEDAPKA